MWGVGQIGKKFVRFEPHVHEECRFLQNCKKMGNTNCGICRVILMRDRFLGEEFHKQVELKKNVNPYILLVDSAGCNMNCWFCYAHEMIKQEDYERLAPVFNTPEELADCFICKMKMSKRLAKTDQDRFFSRIRITGGEPLHSTNDTIMNVSGLSLIESTIDFYLEFFKKMDSKVEDVLNEGVIQLVGMQKYEPAMSFPTWLATKPGRINVRFDTNGLLFTREENARRFIEGVANCSLSNLRVEIDYSLKGAAPIEARWASSHNLSVNEAAVEDYDIQDHLQYKGLMNIIETRNSLSDKLGDSFSLTVERGINHGKTNGFINFPGSLDWDKFVCRFNNELKAKGLPEVKLSDVDNPIQYAKQFGYLFGRYHSRGACIRLKTSDGAIDYLPWDEKSREKELTSAISRCKDAKKPYKLIFFPCSKETYLSGKPESTTSPQKEAEQPIEAECTAVKSSFSSITSNNLWILTGKLENWTYSIEEDIWGVKAKHKWLWDLLERGDRLIFYVSKPVGGMVGCGKVISKSYETDPLWQDEQASGRSIYPYKIRFEKTFSIPKENWISKRLSIPDPSIPFQHGVNVVESKEHQDMLIGFIESNWNVKL